MAKRGQFRMSPDSIAKSHLETLLNTAPISQTCIKSKLLTFKHLSLQEPKVFLNTRNTLKKLRQL